LRTKNLKNRKMETKTKIFIAIGAAAAITIIIGHKKGWFKSDQQSKATTPVVPTETSKDISREKAMEIYKLWYNKKNEMATTRYTAEGMVMARAVLVALEKSIEDGGWKITPGVDNMIPITKK
jgi:hypothetical protein